jgi:hypothetical protein
MINKEWCCRSCRNEFVSLMPICPRCGAPATRVFLTAPQISTKGVARRTDRILEAKFKQMGISNFSNSGGVNKVSWVSTGSTASSVHGQAQPMIQPMFGGPEQLQKAGFNTANMTMNGQPYQLPDPSRIPPMRLPEVGTKVGQFPPGLSERTSTFAKTDARGNVVEINGSDGK